MTTLIHRVPPRIYRLTFVLVAALLVLGSCGKTTYVGDGRGLFW